MERRNEKLGKGNDVHSGQRLIPIVIPSEARDLVLVCASQNRDPSLRSG